MKALTFLIICMSFGLHIQAQKPNDYPNIYWAWPQKAPDGKTMAIVSLSEIFGYDTEQDTLVLPDLSEYTSDTAAEIQYIPLEEPYRSRFLKGCGIKSNDSLYAYSYSKHRVKAFSIKACKVAAVLNPYGGFLPLNAEDYMFCLAVDSAALQGFEAEFANTFVAVGAQNPFYSGSVANMVWKSSRIEDIPVKLKLTFDSAYAGPVTMGKVFYAEHDGYQFFLQEWPAQQVPEDIRIKVLYVILKKSGELITHRILYSGESAYFAESYDQFTGKLFKNLPPVIFGLQYESFGCPAIYFLEPSLEPLILKCDNRH